MRTPLLLMTLALFSAPVLSAPLTAESPRVHEMTWLDLARAGERVVAVGDRGNIFYSDDEGASWASANVPVDMMLTSVCFADASHGWAVGHDATVLGTTDGGENWTQQYSDPLGGSEADVDVEEDYGEGGVSEGELPDDLYSDDLYSSDPYEAAALPAVDPTGAPFLSVWCDTPERAMAVGGFGYVVTTTDGGDTWQKSMDRLDNPDGWHLYDIESVPGSEGGLFIVGEKGTLFRSRDHGVNWKRLESPYEGSLFGATSTGKQSLLIYGLQGNVWLSRDLGQRWQRVKTGVTPGINDGAVLDDGTIVLVGNSGILLTSHDGGSSLSLRYTSERASLSAVLPRRGGGVLTAGADGLRVIGNLR